MNLNYQTRTEAPIRASKQQAANVERFEREGGPRGGVEPLPLANRIPARFPQQGAGQPERQAVRAAQRLGA